MTKSNGLFASEVVDEHDDFVMLDGPLSLAIRAKGLDNPFSPEIQFNPLATENAFLVSINPPPAPRDDVEHVPCDIVLVIDVSGSMADLAPLPDVEDEREQEAAKLTVLDLVRHASRTIISTLNEKDRLALVTFSQEAEVVQSLTNMTEAAKKETVEKIEKLKDRGATNLWAGIKTGLEQFERHKTVGNVQGLFVLTDGQPNYMCPPQGYVPKLKPLLEKLHVTNHSAPTIQTFGFGYTIRSDLMLSIAKAGNGNFAFIPDVGMIGTVFIHAIANFYAAYATNAVLELALNGCNGVDLRHDSGLPAESQSSGRLRIKLGSIMYGQSRDIVVHHTPEQLWRRVTMNVKLTYTSSYTNVDEYTQNAFGMNQPPNLSQSTLSYHLLRNMLCKAFSMLYPVDFKGQNTTATLSIVASRVSIFDAVIDKLTTIPESSTQPDLCSLLLDLIGAQLDPQHKKNGQVYQALQTDSVVKGSRICKSYWEKWGRHYLSSLWCAHMRQTCNSFKDPGPLQYGTHSELFKRCRDGLDTAFDSLPPPKGTWTGYATPPAIPNTMGAPYRRAANTNTANGSMSSPPVSMSRWNRRDNPCFLGSCSAALSNGQMTTVEELRPGMTVSSSMTGTSMSIAAILKSPTNPGAELCRVGNDLWITPWHPVFHIMSKKWVFPADVADEVKTFNDTVYVYSILMHPSNDVNDHALSVGGVSCVTLGHGLLQDDQDDVRAHSFWGSHEKIWTWVFEGSGVSVDEHGRHLCVSVRGEGTGAVVGLISAELLLHDEEKKVCSVLENMQDWNVREVSQIGSRAKALEVM